MQATGTEVLVDRAGTGRRGALLIALGMCLVMGAIVGSVRAWTYRPVPVRELGLAALEEIEGPGATPRPERRSEPIVAMGFPWVGAIHAHTSVSDGSGGIEEIIAAGRHADLDFLIVSDHNPLGGGRLEGGWYGDLLLIVAEEISTVDGHLLALEIPPHDWALGPTGRAAAADILDLGGTVLVAHPDHRNTPWTGGWALAAGLEVISLSSAWSRAEAWPRAATVATWPVNPAYAAVRLLARRPPGLKTLDRLTALDGDAPRPRPRVPVAAVDAHGGLGLLPLPGYARTFGVLATVVWAERPPADEDGSRLEAGAAERMLSRRIREGRTAALVRAVGDLGDFNFTARREGGGRWVLPGEMAPIEEGPWTVRVDLGYPGPYVLSLLRDGEEVAGSVAEPLEVVVDEPGTYRAEVYRVRGPAGAGQRGSTPWIASAPIYLWPGPARRASEVRRVPPVPAPPLVDTLLRLRHWGGEASGGADSSLTGVPGARRWRFELPDRGREGTAALALRPEGGPIDLSAHHGLGVRVRSPQTMRLALEIRTAGPDGTTRSWRGSVKVDGDRRTRPLLWSDFLLVRDEGLARASGGVPAAELESVEAVFLMVTTPALAAPGPFDLEVLEIGLF